MKQQRHQTSSTNQQRHQVFTFVPLKMYKLLKTITGRYLFYNQTSLPRRPLWCHALWKFGNSKCCVFKRRHGAENLYKDLLFGQLQPVIPLRGPRYFDFRIWWCHGENAPIDRWRHESATGDDQSQPRAFLIKNGRRAPPTRSTPIGCVRIARFARVRLVPYSLPISLHILRKSPTVLQSRHTAGFTVQYLTQRC